MKTEQKANPALFCSSISFLLRCMLVLLLLSVLSSSRKSDKSRAVDLVSQWKDREIIYPSDMVFTIWGKDTVEYSIPKSQFTIISYVDSSGCTSCKLKLHQWQNFIFELKKLDTPVPALFFLFPKDTGSITSILEQNNFDHPVCLDSSDSFNKLNHFPNDIMFQTFLIDKDRKVLAMGNPVHNPKVKELYWDIISGKQVGAKKQEQLTKVVVLSTQLDFGGFDWEDAQTSAFSLQNAGKYPLVVQDITISCGCTSVEYSKEPVASGKSLDIKVIYKADHPERFNKTITVYCNAAASPLQFKVTGEAK